MLKSVMNIFLPGPDSPGGNIHPTTTHNMRRMLSIVSKEIHPFRSIRKTTFEENSVCAEVERWSNHARLAV